MPVEWDKLRTLDGSQTAAFEELICQLAHYERMPSGSGFVRKGTPDAGVECFWKLPSDSEHAWQAKFFTSPPSARQWGQVDESVKTALEKHPNLTQYTVCMAFDRPDARKDGKKSCLDHWDDHVAKWKNGAAEKGMTVEFVYWGSHQIFERLSRSEHQGKHFFWFNEELLSPSWFQQQVADTIAMVGPRYTPELNVQLPISAVFEGLSRSPEFLARFQEAYGGIGKAWSKSSLRALEDDASEQVESFEQKLNQVIEIAKTYDRRGVERIDWLLLERLVGEAAKLAYEIDRLIDDLAEKARKDRSGNMAAKASGYSGHDEFSYARHSLYHIIEKLEDIGEFVRSDVARLANKGALLLVGGAGTGKTHLFCDAAQKHVGDDCPAVLLLGSWFRDEEPWGQILRRLGLSCTREQFLGALESAAQLSGRRAVIFIDALNESEHSSFGETELPAILSRLERYPGIAIAVSVRSSYERLVAQKDLAPSRLERVVHHGFVGQEYHATKAFFDFYEIELPAVPPLTPEFENPLFLCCFCKGLNNRGLTRIPPGIHGISSVFDFFLSSVNEKLAKPDSLDYDVTSNLVGQAVQKLAALISETGKYSILRPVAKEICANLLPNRGFEKSLFHHLLSEGVISKTVSYDDGKHQHMITFSYERLADHLVMRELLAGVDPEDPTVAFASDQPLGKCFKDAMTCWRNQGLTEALAIQGPERLGKEVFELVPHCMADRPVCEAFIDSLLWRDPATISDVCLDYINEYVVPDDELNRRLTNVFLTVAPVPDHPFNADFLHNNLIKTDLAERDSWWSVFLYEEYGNKGAVDRLVDWAWSDTDKAHIKPNSLCLAGKALVWFLTTSHRFLRDRATKALVSLFTDRIPVLCQVLPDFRGVNDPYVLERVYAVAYGCALRSKDSGAKRSLAQLVYDLVFKDGTPPCHILLRDYARGVVEVALRDGLELEGVESDKIRPPYTSDWPLVIPSEEEVEALRDGMRDDDGVLSMIYWSVKRDGDFARYILGADGGYLNWSDRSISEPSRKEQHDAFVASLTERQKKAWDDYTATRQSQELTRQLDRLIEVSKEDGDSSEIKLDGVSKPDTADERAQCRFCRTLGGKKQHLFYDVALPYLNTSPEELALPVSIAQRWILKRVLDVGWTAERFGRFDRHRAGRGNVGRSADKPERIGKKYQWLAYHEFLAHLADNCEFHENTWSKMSDIYDGPWQLSLRNIDPSCTLKTTSRSHLKPNALAWWAPVCFDTWAQEMDETEWLKSSDLLPSIEHLPIVIDPGSGRKWLVLECNYHWEEPAPPDKDRFSIPRKSIRYTLETYLVKAEDESHFCDWAKDQRFAGHSMPESNEQTRIFLGEFFWAPAFRYHDNYYYGHEGWTRGHDNHLPCDVLVTTDMYMQERGGYDCSIDDTIFMYLPAKWIADNMALSWDGSGSSFSCPAGNVVAQDPSIRNPGPSALLMDKEFLSAFLEAEGYRVVWVIRGSKRVLDGSRRHEDWPGEMDLSGYIRMDGDRILGEATTFWVTRGPQYTKMGTINISSDGSP